MLATSTELEQRSCHVYSNGAEYTGYWRGVKRESYGVQTWPNGAKYEGNWLDNMAHGKGTFYHANGDIYDGEWVHDKAHGYGVYKHRDGLTICNTVRGKSNGLTKVHTMGNTETERSMGKVNTFGLMETIIVENG